MINSYCPIYDSELQSYLDEEYNTTDSKTSPNMCIVTLSVLEKFRHELATIDYCKKVDEKAKERDTTNVESGETSTTPRETCTRSLGWLIYQSLTVSLMRQMKERTDHR